MFNFKDWSIARKLAVVLALIVVSIGLLSVISVIGKRNAVMAEKEQATKNHVEEAMGILENFYALQQSGKMSEAEAKQAAFAVFMKLRYDGNNYFSISNVVTRMSEMHPFRPDIVGQKPEDQDPKLRYVSEGLIEAAKQPGGGFFHYTWQKPGAPAGAPAVAKLAYSKLFAPWNLSVSTGIYTDDVDAAMRSDAIVFGLEAITSIAIVVLLLVIISRSITKPLRAGLECADAIAKGKLDNQIESQGKDEAGQLLESLRKVQDTVQSIVAAQATMAKEHHEGAISYRIDDKLFPGTYGTMARQVNDMVGEHIAVNTRVVEIVTAYADGDFSVDMDRLPKEKAKITAAIDGVKASFQAINSQVRELVAAAGRGDFTVRGDATRFRHEFAEMVTGLNELMTTCDYSLSEIGRVLSALSEGDLTQGVEGEFQGTFGQLKDDANRTVASLREIVSEIRVATESINTAATEIAQGNLDLSGRTEAQAASLEETAASMEELTTTVKETAENARQSSNQAGEAVKLATEGGESVGKVVETMRAISESSKRISDIIGVIDGIAFQTNILALNAAVEAARAGEQGRGFAVVATEVRSLAQRSAAAAKEIKDVISNSAQTVEVGARQVDEAGKTMGTMVSSVDRVRQFISDISAASVEQSSGIDQVNSAVSQMDQVTQQNAALVEEAAAAAKSMEEQAHALTTMVARFRLSGATVSPAASGSTPGLRVVKAAQKPALTNSSKAQSRPTKPKVAAPKQSAATATSAESDWQEF